MISRIVIHNFQCHKDLDLDLGRSTVLSGNSNSGKTAVLRALYWVLYNTPSGDSYVSYWAKNKTKFKPDEYTSVAVHVDGHVVERRRSNDFNGYIVDGTTYEALRTAVPEQVTKIFNVADASVQRQMDPPFLLSSTPGEASQYLNELAGLTCVDDILAIAKKKASDTSSLVDSTRVSVGSLEKEVSSLSWVESAEKLLAKAEELTGAIEQSERTLSALRKTISDYKGIRSYPEIPAWLDTPDATPRIRSLEADLSSARTYVGALRAIARIDTALDGISALEVPKQPKHTAEDVEALKRSISDYARCTGRIDGYESALSRMPREPRKVPRDVLTALSSSVDGYRRAVSAIAQADADLEKAYESMDGMVCPVCGRPLTKECL